MEPFQDFGDDVFHFTWFAQPNDDVRDRDELPRWPFSGTRIEVFGRKRWMMLGRHGNGWEVFDSDFRSVAHRYSRQLNDRHFANFLDCVRTRKRPNADVEQVHLSTLLCHYGNIAYRVGRKLVNILPPLKWGSFWANPAIAELGAQGLIPAPLEHVDCGVVVPIQGHAASALKPAIPERKMLEACTATRARLGRVGRIDLDHFATSTFSLVREAGDKVGPTCIQDAHGEAAGKGPQQDAGEGGNPQVFEHDPIEPRDEFVDELVEEVFPCIGYMDHQALQPADKPATVATAHDAPGDLALQDAQFPENPAIPTGVFFLLPIAERGQAHETQVDADRFPSPRQRLGFLDLAGEGDEPLARPAEDTGRLDRVPSSLRCQRTAIRPMPKR